MTATAALWNGYERQVPPQGVRNSSLRHGRTLREVSRQGHVGVRRRRAPPRPLHPEAPGAWHYRGTDQSLGLVDLSNGVCDVAQYMQPFCAAANLIGDLGRSVTKWLAARPSTLERQSNPRVVAADRR